LVEEVALATVTRPLEQTAHLSPGLETGASAPSSTDGEGSASSSTSDQSGHAKSAAVEESSSSDETAAEKDEAK
jgi:hypothetical protein